MSEMQKGKFQLIQVEKIIRENPKGVPIGRVSYIVPYRFTDEDSEYSSIDLGTQVESTISELASIEHKDEENVYIVLGLTTTHSPRKRDPEDYIRIFDDNFLNILERLEGELIAYLNKEHDKVLISCPLNKLNEFNESKRYDYRYFIDKVNRISPLLLNEQLSKDIIEYEEKTEEMFVIIILIPNIAEEKKTKYTNEISDYLREISKECAILEQEGMIITKLSYVESEEILKLFNYILKIEVVPEAKLQDMEISSESIEKIVNDFSDSEIEDLPVVCILDTGVSTIPVLQKVVISRDGLPIFPDFTDGNDRRGHGTGIACLTSLGETLDEPYSKIISFKIFSHTRRNVAFQGIRQGIF